MIGIKTHFLFQVIAVTTVTALTSQTVFAQARSITTSSYTGQTLAQSYTQDIQGWNRTRWGMSVDEVRKLFPGIESSTPSTTGDSRYVLKNVSLNRAVFDISFVFGANGLKVVNLDQKGKDVELNFRMLLQDLQEKYGRPASQNSIGAIKWILPSTEITLLRMNNPTDSSKNLLFLSYTPKQIRQDI
jgi:hypothetical protein